MTAAAQPLHGSIMMAPLIRALTISSLFAGGLKVTVGIDLRLSYLFVALAYGSILFLTPRPVLPIRPLAVLFAWLAWCTIATMVVAPRLLVSATVPQVVGIGFFASFFLIFFANSKTDAVDLFRTYVRVAFWVALLGLPILAFTGLTEGFWRLRSLFAEPAHYAIAMMPATAYALAQARQRPGRAIIFVGAMLLTISLTGFIGLGLALALVIGRRWYTRMMLAVLGAGLMFGAYTASSEIRKRIDDTARVATTSDFEGANLSTYALLSNLYVAWRSFSDHPVTGGGLGSHKFSHERFIGKLDGLDAFEEYLEQNKQDANSLLARIVSEQGLIGTGLVLLFLWQYRQAAYTTNQVISTSILIYFILKLVRDGHYFTPEFFFMIGIFVALSQGRSHPQ